MKEQLLHEFNETTKDLLATLSLFTEEITWQERKVGRKQLPSTVHGLLFHAAEHTMRHTGQLLVTIVVLKNIYQQS